MSKKDISYNVDRIKIQTAGYRTVNQVSGVKRAEGGQGTRANKESSGRIDQGSGELLGSSLTISPNPSFLQERQAVFDRLFKKYEESVAARPDIAISITLPNGDVKQGIAFKTTPYDIAKYGFVYRFLQMRF